METKECCICKRLLSVDKFSTRTDRKTLTYQSSCKECHSEYRKQHYLLNKAKYIKKAKEQNKKERETFQKEKEKLVCSECGESRWWVLDFHHLDKTKKDSSIASLMARGLRAKAMKEIEKCIVLCSNCHRNLHHQERQAGKVLMHTH